MEINKKCIVVFQKANIDEILEDLELDNEFSINNKGIISKRQYFKLYLH